MERTGDLRLGAAVRHARSSHRLVGEIVVVDVAKHQRERQDPHERAIALGADPAGLLGRRARAECVERL